MRKLIIILAINLLIVNNIWCIPAFQRGTAANIPQLMQYAAASGLYQDASGAGAAAAASAQVQPSSAQSSQAQPSQAQTNGNASTNGTAAGPAGLGAPPVFGMPIPASFMWSFPFPGQGIYLLFF